MTIPTIGRNDPCPCGSGKKFKKCCLGTLESVPSDRGAAAASADLRQAMEGMQFGSLREVQAFVGRHTLQRNRKALDEFHGLSPEQMHCMLDLPFASPDLIRFPEVLDTDPTAPIVSLFGMLSDAIGDKGLKQTAKGNLPQKFCREAALAYWGEDVYRENTRVGGINREDDFLDLHITRLTAELAGLIRKYKGRFILSRDCRAVLNGQGLAALYPRLFKAYVEQFNWGYWDRYPELRFIQTAFLFTLYLLTRYGDTWRPQEFYEDCFLSAFPIVLDELPQDQVFTPEEEVRNCYSWRALVHFAGFFGLAKVEPVSDKRFCREYRVKRLPLLHDAVHFRWSR
ncbi:MAG: SEC-C domain-containing protein [Proteobacteria bacterium]|nr:SEC-C domain-containing protein [Pseudomonadota bacterium]